MIPAVLHAERTCDPRTGDVCISAPTGSGKTLAYVLPIVQCLLTRVVPRVRALVLVPTRDLVHQVYSVFKTYTAGTPLRVMSSAGQRAFLVEQAELQRGAVDILVCTPGRLVDHLDQTTGFTLQHLRFLVVDEADRMLTQSYQNWVHRVYASAFPGHVDDSPGSHTLRALPPPALSVKDAYPGTSTAV